MTAEQACLISGIIAIRTILETEEYTDRYWVFADDRCLQVHC